MNGQKQKVCECFSETDRMINEGLGNGTIIPKYAEVHAQLKEKQESQLLSALNGEITETGGMEK